MPDQSRAHPLKKHCPQSYNRTLGSHTKSPLSANINSFLSTKHESFVFSLAFFLQTPHFLRPIAHWPCSRCKSCCSCCRRDLRTWFSCFVVIISEGDEAALYDAALFAGLWKTHAKTILCATFDTDFTSQGHTTGLLQSEWKTHFLCCTTQTSISCLPLLQKKRQTEVRNNDTQLWCDYNRNLHHLASENLSFQSSLWKPSFQPSVQCGTNHGNNWERKTRGIQKSGPLDVQLCCQKWLVLGDERRYNTVPNRNVVRNRPPERGLCVKMGHQFLLFLTSKPCQLEISVAWPATSWRYDRGTVTSVGEAMLNFRPNAFEGQGRLAEWILTPSQTPLTGTQLEQFLYTSDLEI